MPAQRDRGSKVGHSKKTFRPEDRYLQKTRRLRASEETLSTRAAGCMSRRV